MKLFKKTIFWFIALAALFGASLLIDDRVEEAERIEETDLKLFAFEVDDVAEFWIRAGENGVRAHVVGEMDGWWWSQPLSA